MSDMKLLTTQDLNRRRDELLDAIERGETFELRRTGRAVGYLVGTPAAPECQPGWDSHFEWLAEQGAESSGLAPALDEERRRQRASEDALA